MAIVLICSKISFISRFFLAMLAIRERPFDLLWLKMKATEKKNNMNLNSEILNWIVGHRFKFTFNRFGVSVTTETKFEMFYVLFVGYKCRSSSSSSEKWTSTFATVACEPCIKRRTKRQEWDSASDRTRAIRQKREAWMK